MSAQVAWEKGTCRVPMWMGGVPAGFCDRPANGPQLPRAVLRWRGWDRPPYCHGHCCPDHGGPRDGEPIVFQDGLTEQGRQMWCAVMPDFENLQESPAGFDGDPLKAIEALKAARKQRPECPYCGTHEGLRQVHNGGGCIAPEYTCEGCFVPRDDGPCFNDLPRS